MSDKVLVKVCQLIVGVDLIGSKMSLSTSPNLTLELTPYGVKGVSDKTKREILIPFANIKGMEFFPNNTPPASTEKVRRGRPPNS